MFFTSVCHLNTSPEDAVLRVVQEQVNIMIQMISAYFNHVVLFMDARVHGPVVSL